MHQDLTDCPYDGIIIRADNITLDLNGHMIDGDGLGLFDDGVDNSAGHDGITIRNGTISGFDRGVALIGTTNNFVEAVQVQSPGNGDGILIDGFGNLDSSFNRIEGNSVSGDGTVGIYLYGTSNNLIADNLIIGNSYRGLQLFSSHMNRIEDNVISRNGDQAIALFESDENRISRNEVTANATHGLLIVEDSDQNVVEENLVSTNALGIYIGDSFLRPGAEKNVVVDNSVYDNSYDGIFVQGPLDHPVRPLLGAIETLLGDNFASGNGDDGIDVEAPSTTIHRNTAKSSADLGIEAITGVSDAGGNTARKNGNPLQCLNVICQLGTTSRRIT